ncbi:MAG: YbjN domain-containing protein [Bacteroidia bacterium]|nr:YbjN domain-containing protein [Bacteroidia bacterium]
MENDLQSQYDIVEACIAKLGVDVASTRGQKPGQWSLVKGSAKVWIDLWYIEREKRAYYQVMSPVMKLPEPANRLPFFQELLELNDKLFGVSFSIYNDWTWLKVIREVDGMDENEAFAMLTRVGNYADQYDDYLIGKYQGDAEAGASAPGPAPSGPNFF